MRKHSIRGGIRKFAELDGRQRALLAEAAVHLTLARASLRVLPFSRIARRLGRFRQTAAAEEGRTLPVAPEQRRLAANVAWVIERAAFHLPFDASCLPQALAARAMLRKRGVASVFVLGVGRSPSGRLEAHAWLSAAGVEVAGFPVAPEFREIARLETPGRCRR